MNKRNFLQSLTLSVLVVNAPRLMAQTPAVSVSAVTQSYGALVSAVYADTLTAALALQKSVQVFTDAPSAPTQSAAQQAWLAAREFYGQTEAFRFYSGPIDDAKGPEGRMNGWPMDEAYVDYVKGKPKAGLVNNRKIPISKSGLSKLNAHGGEENIATGWHAIEFLLWGQDTDPNGPGARSFNDFIDGKTPNADRRRQYLRVVTEILVDDLRYLVTSWAPDANNYRASFERGGLESVRKIIVGMGSLSRGELAGERMEVALNSQDQEDEHSCFSDNTHRDIVNNALGIENVWLARYLRLDGSTLQGASLRDLVTSKAPETSARMSAQLATTMAAARDIRAPFDQEIIGKNDAPGRQRVQKTIDSLVQQSKDLTTAANALGVTKLTLVSPSK